MKLPIFIAKRYLFSKKKQNAINIISAISATGVTIGTTALIVILSVFNGIGLLLEQSTDSLTPDIVVSPAQGKFIEFDSSVYQVINDMPEIAYYNPVVEEKALVKYNERLVPVVVKGVAENYNEHTRVDKNLVQGVYSLKSGDIYQSVVGYGIAAQLGIGLTLNTPMYFYYPDKSSSVQSALNSEYLFPVGFFSSQQEIDSKFVITDIAFAQNLFHIANKHSKIEIKLADAESSVEVKTALREKLGSNYKVEDKYELNHSFYAMMKSEKLAVFLILLFILLIASFNIVGSISMLILDKKEDLNIYKALGMSSSNIISIFKTEGNLITVIGATAGLILGVGISMLQEYYGFIKLGDGSYIIDAYPVKLVFSDIALIMITVLIIGYAASYFPVKYLVNKLLSK